ncbi:sensor histidine kinase [Actinocrinis sp.]|uniref:sensor histidine kinase n=1 Tax=Actinocrinis sp. TaxID=1920516 RepID=UPI002CB7FAEB|nr:sensor histidine kinase [Actinocrinis sp.]HXR72426.1 sensor histidine kinase [Actinocrinis sp.]
MSDAPVPCDQSAASGLRHMLYPYSGTSTYLDGLMAYVGEARAAGASVVVCAPEDRCDLLRGYLHNGDSVAFMDLTALGNNPGRLIPAWQEWIERRSNAGAVHGIGESVWSGRSTARLSELRYHEWLLNVAFEQAPAWSLLCPYDTTGQSEETIQALSRSHPYVWDGVAGTTAEQYAAAPYAFAPLAGPHAPFDEKTYTIEDLTALRELVTEWATTHSLSTDRTRDLLLAVTEVASNSIRHGGGGGTLRIWVEDGALVCEFRDAGVISNPMVGRVRPAANQIGGCGLWFVHQLCDLVEIRSGPSHGTRVRLHMDLPYTQGEEKT